MKNDDIAILVMTIQRAGANKTTRYLDRNNFDDYYVMIPSGLEPEVAESYGEHAVVYDVDKMKAKVDFMGTGIDNGCAVGRMACNDWIRNRPDYKMAVVLDDDYGGVVSDYTTTPTLNNKTFYEVVKAVYKLGKDLGITTGGYSGGAHPCSKKGDDGEWHRIDGTRRNIMNIFIIDKTIEDRGFNKILNEDICYSIYKWHRVKAVFGMLNAIRSGAQTAEMEKSDGNTKLIYATDRSYRKSFGAILADPKNAKLTWNSGNTKRGALWHHRVNWSDIAPKIILEEK
jgi:hypothetical protein